MYTCRDVTRLISSEEYLHAGLWVRAKVRIHLAMCQACSEYVKQIRLLGERARAVLWAPHPVDAAEAARLEKRILQGIRGGQVTGDGG